MVIDDQNTYINKIGSGAKVSNQKFSNKLPGNVETFSNFLKNKIENSSDMEFGVKFSGHAKKDSKKEI